MQLAQIAIFILMVTGATAARATNDFADCDFLLLDAVQNPNGFFFSAPTSKRQARQSTAEVTPNQTLSDSPSRQQVEAYLKIVNPEWDPATLKIVLDAYFDSSKEAQTLLSQLVEKSKQLANPQPVRPAHQPVDFSVIDFLQGIDFFIINDRNADHYFVRVLDQYNLQENPNHQVRLEVILIELMNAATKVRSLRVLRPEHIEYADFSEQAGKTAKEAFDQQRTARQRYLHSLFLNLTPSPLTREYRTSLNEEHLLAFGPKGLKMLNQSNSQILENWPMDRLLNWAIDLDGTFRLSPGVLLEDVASKTHLYLATRQKPALIGGYLSLVQYQQKADRRKWTVDVILDYEHFQKAIDQDLLEPKSALRAKIIKAFQTEFGSQIKVRQVHYGRKKSI